MKRLDDNGLRCRIEKCQFAQPTVDYLGYRLSSNGVAKGEKVDDVIRMPPPTSKSELRSFMGSLQFYSQFLPNMSTIAEPLNQLTRNDVTWSWKEPQQQAFNRFKEMLSSNLVLAHFDPKMRVGISCDASDVGIGAVLFHRYDDGTERPICNVSKTLTTTQRRYSQIQKEALSIIFALKKFHHYLYGREFILITDHKPLLALFGPSTATPALAANRLARWALMLSQYQYKIEYRRSADHGNADALSRLPSGPDADFDKEEDDEDEHQICMVKTISSQLNPSDSELMVKETAKDPIISNIIRYTREGWPNTVDATLTPFKTIRDSLSTSNGCLFHGSRLVVPKVLQERILELLHIGHMGREKMKKLARTAVYWPGIDAAIVQLSQRCQECAEQQDAPPKAPVHPWTVPEKPWMRLHIDHAINFMGSNWLVVVDAFSKYPCIHPTSSTSSKTTIELLEQDMAHFGYPQAIVSDNGPAFSSQEFKEWCRSHGITHLTGAPYHPATNGAAERMVQTFKKALKKSSLPPRRAIHEFLMQYRRTPTMNGYSPSEMLNNRQIRTLVDALTPSPALIMQQKQTSPPREIRPRFPVGSPVYARCYQPPGSSTPERWVPAVVTKSSHRNCTVRLEPRGPTWRRHIEQLRLRHSSSEDNEPGELPVTLPGIPTNDEPELPEYGRHNLRRSKRNRRPISRYH